MPVILKQFTLLTIFAHWLLKIIPERGRRRNSCDWRQRTGCDFIAFLQASSFLITFANLKNKTFLDI